MTKDDVRSLFVYESSGTLRKITNFRKPYPWRGIGKEGRYLATTSLGKSYYLHQLVFLYHFGYIPSSIDHINGDTRDNRIENLRECTQAQNQYNSKRKVNNRSGVKGVVFHANCPGKPWQAKIVVDGRTISLGYYADIKDAAIAYENGAIKYAKEFAKADSNIKD